MPEGTVPPLYDTDFYAWTMIQATELRAMAERRVNAPIDLVHLAEEVEDLGKSERDAVRSQVRRIIEHFLKLEHAGAGEPRADWRADWKESIIDARGILFDKMTPSLQRDIAAVLPDLYRQARQNAAMGLWKVRDFAAVETLPETCGYTLDDICRDGWYPENRYGAQD